VALASSAIDSSRFTVAEIRICIGHFYAFSQRALTVSGHDIIQVIHGELRSQTVTSNKIDSISSLSPIAAVGIEKIGVRLLQFN